MKYIEQLLNSLEPIAPIETGLTARYSKNHTFKAVIFDIYGTLLVSSSGDIDQATASAVNLERALQSSNITINGNKQQVLGTLLKEFKHTIQICHSDAKKNNVPFPEVDILSIWEIVLIHAHRNKLISYNGDTNIMHLTCTYEFLSNKVYPMPGMKEVISHLHNKKIPLGIVSNAQFYTPVLMNYFLHNSTGLDEEIGFFDPELTVFSYKLGIGKPDSKLFDELVPILIKKYGIVPSQVLFIGNDMLKDIVASKAAGFKTALFAGDKRSLRLHTHDKRVNGIVPDYIITSLQQITEIIDL